MRLGPTSRRRRPRRALAPTALAALMLFGAVPDARADELDDFVRARMERRHIPGLSLAVLKDGKVVKMRGYGLASVEFGAPATENSVYQIASITKTFTATAVMLLVAEGRLGLDDRVVDRLGGLPASWGDVTVRHLLTHTSGLTVDATPWTWETAGLIYSRDDYMKRLTAAPLQFPAGTRYSYSNSGYAVLALLVEAVGGRPYGEFLAERIFRPLGMTSTRVNDPSEVVRFRAAGYGWEGNTLKASGLIHPSHSFGSGDLLSTAADLSKFVVGIAEGRLLPRPVVDLMWTPARLAGGEEVSYGLGWNVFKVRGHRVVGHGGNSTGFASQMFRFGDGTVIVLLCNGTWGDDMPFKMSLRLAGLVVPELAIPSRPTADGDPVFTAKVRALVEGLGAGRVDASLLSPRLAGLLTPQALESTRRTYEGQYGTLRSMALLERRADGPARHSMYRAVFARKTLLLYVTATGDGRIDDFGQEPEEE
jgi:D-alanyl-D-alanine carboxypeptidase